MVEEAVRPEQIAEVVERWTGIPTSRMLEGEREKLLRMEEALGKRVVGQRPAVEAVSRAVRRARAGLNDPNRPLGSFLFLGPTGVGKTELTKALAEFLFDDDTAMVRVDMSEFMEKHSVSRLIGAPPGYVGYDEGGVLTEAVRRRPYQVVLFDEVEKAHPDVFNVLLQVLDDGMLTDGQGRTVDFKQTLIVLTSNLGARALSELPEGADSSAAGRGDGGGPDPLPARFLNRLDEMIIFDRLDRSDMAGIVEIQLRRLEERLAGRKMRLELDEAARQWLADEGYDPVFGARPLKRVIQRALQDQARRDDPGGRGHGRGHGAGDGRPVWPDRRQPRRGADPARAAGGRRRPLNLCVRQPPVERSTGGFTSPVGPGKNREVARIGLAIVVDKSQAAGFRSCAVGDGSSGELIHADCECFGRDKPSGGLYGIVGYRGEQCPSIGANKLVFNLCPRQGCRLRQLQYVHLHGTGHEGRGLCRGRPVRHGGHDDYRCGRRP
jgi:MoxR-like ATPase